MAEAVTLAHVVRPLALAEGLDGTRYDVHFAVADNDLMQGKDFIFQRPTVTRWKLESQSSARFLQATRVGSRLYDVATLERYVHSDLALLRRVQPALVVGDLRLSLSTSARLLGIPYVAITNAYWSPALSYARIPRPDFARGPRWVRECGNRLAQLALPLGFRWHARPLNQLRRRHGLAARGEFRAAYSDADLVLYADHPGLVPLAAIPAHHHYLGPITWSPVASQPSWWDQVPRDMPCIYVAMGSSGATASVPMILDDLHQLSVTTLVAGATSDRDRERSSCSFHAPYLPGAAAAARSQLVVCNGGSGSVYQALASGVPVLGIASNLDQLLMMSHCERAGCGILLRASDLRPGQVAAAARRLLQEPSFRHAAQRLQRELARTDAHGAFATHCEALLAGAGSASTHRSALGAVAAQASDAAAVAHPGGAGLTPGTDPSRLPVLPLIPTRAP